MSRADSAAVRAFVARTSRRLVALATLEGVAIGLAGAALLALLGWPDRASGVAPMAFGLFAGAVGVLGRLAATRRRRARPAELAERAAPECRNLLVTADELASSGTAANVVTAEVMRRAGLLVDRLDVHSLFPLRRSVVVAALSGAIWIASLARATGGTVSGRALSAVPMLDEIELTIHPPPYSGLPARTVRDPDRVEALAGSLIAIRARSNAAAVVLTTADTTRALVRSGDAFAGDIAVTVDGFLSLEPRANDGGITGPRRLIGISARPDAAPRARITAPAKDLVLPDGKRAIDVTVEADDDVALADLRLRFTKVTGSGERFTFVEGAVPLSVSRRGPRSWRATTRWQLDSLGLEPGDMVVYRAWAADGRPGSAGSESDAFIAEIATPGGVAAAGFAMDPDQERYALSQQMIVLKTERLLARRRALSESAYADSAAEIASEQRRVRAEFVFMMGGELNDGAVDEASMTDINEEAEAEAEADLLAGREANLGRVALRRATRSMSRAARALTDVDVAAALVEARAAVRQLELAFARNRIILRALAERESLDPARRLTGEMTEIARSSRITIPATSPARVAALRFVLSDLARLVRDTRANGTGPATADGAVVDDRGRRASAAAEALLRIDPSARPMQDAASALASAATAFARADESAAMAAVDRASLVVATELKRSLPGKSVGRVSLEDAVSRGAIRDLLAGRKP